MKIKIERKLNYKICYDGGFCGIGHTIQLTVKSPDGKDVFSNLLQTKKETKRRIRDAKMSATDREYRIYSINELTLVELVEEYIEDIEVDKNDVLEGVV